MMHGQQNIKKNALVVFDLLYLHLSCIQHNGDGPLKDYLPTGWDKKLHWFAYGDIIQRDISCFSDQIVAKIVNVLLGWGDKNLLRILVGNFRKCTLTRPRKRWQDNKKTDRRNLVRVQWWSNAGPLTAGSSSGEKKFLLVPQEGRAPLKIFTLNREECQLQ